MNHFVIYHEPDCCTSSNTLAMIRNAGTGERRLAVVQRGEPDCRSA
ncbi:hypothetical protein [Paraburkholderia atlantica]|nr:hypothetical protein [Paraburkholderia atlantica]